MSLSDHSVRREPRGSGTCDVSWYTTQVSGPGADVPVRILRPTGPRNGWTVWAHGGSWHHGSALTWHHACADLAVAAATTVVSVDYRLAPEHPHPAALEDFLTAVAWAQEQAAGEATEVAVGGDSAGGTIAACAALVLRDSGGHLAAQVLAYPPIDPQCRADSYHRDPCAFPAAGALTAAWRGYRGEHPDGSGGLYSTPMEAADLTGAAPAIIAVGELDPVIDDVRDYQRRLHAAGVPVRYLELARTAHGAFLEPVPARLARPRGPSLRSWLGRALAHAFAQRTGVTLPPRQRTFS
ncbi:acetyl esterase [Krasilnikovia cinnamomea]|uniref:Acetyl esterase n=1 Tax=Krasilnikovia cinnamomea TaxID=349313 RepID=A0A4Q7ZTC4_9ACTN|nr:alpha/beta hydrolase fold domain-containing protein [Krasilnikovia cinnamomea]RZU53775.1 acetyl esterase [Krasilnikovia cinnamomea]